MSINNIFQQSHILKISDEELEFLTGTDQIEGALKQLFIGNVEMIVYTKGAGGAECYTKRARAKVEGRKVKALDTTGAGDGFIGAFLYQLYVHNVKAGNMDEVSSQEMEVYLDFANRFSALSVQKKGAIASYPTMVEMEGNPGLLEKERG